MLISSYCLELFIQIRERVLSRIHSVKNDVALSEVVISDFIPNIR